MKFLRFGVLLTLVLSVMPIGMMQIRASADVDGVWLSHGYGMIIEINGEQFTVYDLTPVSCVPLYDQTAQHDLGLQFSVENGELMISNIGTLYITAERIDTLPETCANGGTLSDDPELNFEVFWNDFNDQYAFFDLYGVDWQSQYDHYRPLVTADTTPDELFALLSEMISPLNDDHLSLSNGDDSFAPAAPPTWISNEVMLIPTLLSFLNVITQNYLQADITFNLDTLAFEGDEAFIGNNAIIYGKLNDQVGYVFILIEGSYTANSTEESDIVIAGATMDRIITEFADLDTMIIDVRYNFGGSDAVALTLASRFADQRRLVCSKQARDDNGFAPSHDFFVEPGGPQQFTKDVIVLTSQMTVSAGETFILAMDELPNVTIIGETTAGAYSDVLQRVLPNGWEFGLSNEVYIAANGQNYESVGNPPDIDIPLDAAKYQAGTDNILDTALEMAAQ
jgi:hypothetical protein